jgi:branched-subunit amino acid ABC-type transport system permease component
VEHLDLLLPMSIVGVVLGSMYALPAMGIVMIYKTSRVLNFAHGAMGMFSTFVAYQLSVLWHLPSALAVVGAVVFAALLGLVIERFTIAPLEGKPTLSKVVVTLGWLLVLTAAAGFLWGASAYHAPISLAPPGTVHLPGVEISYLQIMNLGVAAGLTALLAFFFKRTRLGTAMRAVADNVKAARILGIRVSVVNSASWVVGSVLAAIAGILLSPMITLNTTQLTLLVVSAFAAALVGGLVSLPITFAAAIGLGILHSDIGIWVTTPGPKDLVTLGVILIALLWRGSGLARSLESA